MSTASFSGLLVISAIAVAAPILATSVRHVKLPSAVVEVVAGIIAGHPQPAGAGQLTSLLAQAKRYRDR